MMLSSRLRNKIGIVLPCVGTQFSTESLELQGSTISCMQDLSRVVPWREKARKESSLACEEQISLAMTGGWVTQPRRACRCANKVCRVISSRYFPHRLVSCHDIRTSGVRDREMTVVGGGGEKK